MKRFVWDGPERPAEGYGREAEARIDAGIQLLAQRYRHQMASAPLLGRVRLWLTSSLAQRQLRRTIETAYFGGERPRLPRSQRRPADVSPSRAVNAGDTTAQGGNERRASGRPGRGTPIHASAGGVRGS